MNNKFDGKTGIKSTRHEPPASFRIPGVVVRIISVLFFALVVVWLGYGIHKNDLAVPTKNRGLAHFHGRAVWFMSGSIFCFAASVVAWLNIPKSRKFIRWIYYLGWSLFATGIVVAICGIQIRHPPQRSDLWMFFFILLCGFSLYALVALMASTIPGGWGSFAKRYQASTRPDGNSYSAVGCWWYDRSFSRYIYGRGRFLWVILADNGVYFYKTFLARIGAAPFLLPWESIKHITKGHGFSREYYVLEIVDDVGKFRVELPEKIHQELMRLQKDSLIDK